MMRSQRTTRQRQVILEELRRLSSHPTANDLYRIVRERLPNVSLGTIYRNLGLLVGSGSIRRIATSGREGRYDSRLDDHCHVRCFQCGRVDDFVSPLPPMIEGQTTAQSGWEIHEYRIELLGLCPECKEKRDVEEDSQ